MHWIIYCGILFCATMSLRQYFRRRYQKSFFTWPAKAMCAALLILPTPIYLVLADGCTRLNEIPIEWKVGPALVIVTLVSGAWNLTLFSCRDAAVATVGQLAVFAVFLALGLSPAELINAVEKVDATGRPLRCISG